MQTSPQNKMAGGTTLLEGERGTAEEHVYCRCGQMVAVPYAGAVTCPNCRHETHWLSRFDTARRKSAIAIETVVVNQETV